MIWPMSIAASPRAKPKGAASPPVKISAREMEAPTQRSSILFLFTVTPSWGCRQKNASPDIPRRRSLFIQSPYASITRIRFAGLRYKILLSAGTPVPRLSYITRLQALSREQRKKPPSILFSLLFYYCTAPLIITLPLPYFSEPVTMISLILNVVVEALKLYDIIRAKRAI